MSKRAIRKARAAMVVRETAPTLGRPSGYTEELTARICERMGEGELVIDICSEPDFPSLSTLHRWREQHETFREAYARARVAQAQACAEMAVRRARCAAPDDVAAARLQFDADRWFAARMDPANFSDRVAVQPLGKDGKPADATVTYRWADPPEPESNPSPTPKQTS